MPSVYGPGTTYSGGPGMAPGYILPALPPVPQQTLYSYLPKGGGPSPQWDPASGNVTFNGQIIGNTDAQNAWNGGSTQTFGLMMPSAAQMQTMRMQQQTANLQSAATAAQGNGGASPAAAAPGVAPPPSAAGPYVPPEIQALQDIAQIDPGQAALTAQLENTYNNTLLPNAVGQVPGTAALAGANTQALMDDLARQEGLVQSQQAQYDLGSQLDPEMQREIQQYVRGAQVARGNSEGGAQTVEEAMTQGQAGEQLRQQRLANYGGALSQYGSTLGLTTAAQQQNQTYLQNVLNQAQGYITGGATPYAQGTGYVNNAINQQTAAMSGSTIQQPAVPPASYLYLNPNAGTQFAQGAQQYYNSGVGATPGSPDTSGQYIGAGIGAIGAIAGASILAFCWVAREVFGGDNPRWIEFRNWLLTCAPVWLQQLYATKGAEFARRIRHKPRIKRAIKIWMESRLAN